MANASTQQPLEAYELAFQRLNLFALRRIFYVVTPAETRFPTVEAIPNWYDETGPWFAMLILTETLALQLTGKHKAWRWNDSVTNLMAGVFSMLFRLFNRGLGMAMYVYLYSHCRLVDLPWDSNWTWLLAFLTQDLAYYLWHRALHEFGFFWAFHQMHHSSEYYNLTVALRQGVIQEFASSCFELWQALIIPPHVYLVHRYLNILNQFWVHTELVPKLGPLEWVFNTPSHHRVHHGRNPYCIDKNYGGTLIIWDRLFGTFSEEKHEEPVAYGLVHNVNSFDQFYVQFFVFKELLWDKPVHWMPKGTSLKDRLLALVYPVGWMPGTKLKWFLWWRLADTEEGIPEVEQPVVKHNPRLPRKQLYYVLAHFCLHFYVYQTFLDNFNNMSALVMAAGIVYQIVNMQSLGYLLENKWFAGQFELAKCVLTAAFSVYGMMWLHGRYVLLLAPMFVSALFWLAVDLPQPPPRPQPQHVKHD